MAWSYKRETRQFATIPEGEYRIRIRDVEKKVSAKGNEYLAFQFDVSGRNELLFHNITFLTDKPQITNRMLTQFFDSFKDIPDGDFNIRNWVGKVGACKIRHEESDYNGGTTQARVHYFIEASKQEQLPPWKEPAGRKPPEKNWSEDPRAEEEFMPVPEDATDLPFNMPLF